MSFLPIFRAELRPTLRLAIPLILAELGAPALVVPASSNGLGLTDVDLVGVIEEAGLACLPEPLLETAAIAAPPSRRSSLSPPPPRPSAR